MKRCNTFEFRVTMIDNTTLLDRLASEVRFVGYQLRQTWPEFRSDPLRFGGNVFAEGKLRLRCALTAPNARAAISAAMLVMMSGALILFLTDGMSKKKEPQGAEEELAQITMVNFPFRSRSSPNF